VTGILRLPPSDGPYRVARVRVSVRDVTELDGPAETIAERELPGTDVPESGAELPFELDVELDPRRTYAVRAHASRGGSPSVESGDLVSTTAHVIGPMYQEGLVVPLHVVGG
jgi:Type III secretion system lipoprotein chaperone (YscW)